LVLQEARRFLAIDPESYGPYWQHRYWVLPHFLGGAVALLLGPALFWTGRRRRYLRLHRWMDRLYLTGVGVGAATSFYLAAHSAIGWMLGVALFTLAAAWVTTTAMGYVAIRRGQVAAHREWMTRSYVQTYSFVVARLLLASPVLKGASPHERFTTLGWLSWTVPLLLTEVALQWRRSVAAAPDSPTEGAEGLARPEAASRAAGLETAPR
jgi:uncharacterized membrane protein